MTRDSHLTATHPRSEETHAVEVRSGSMEWVETDCGVRYEPVDVDQVDADDVLDELTCGTCQRSRRAEVEG